MGRGASGLNAKTRPIRYIENSIFRYVENLDTIQIEHPISHTEQAIRAPEVEGDAVENTQDEHTRPREGFPN